MATKVTGLRLDEKTKEQAYTILETLGMKPAQAINLFLRQVVLHKGLPFDVKIPNAETIQAMKELDGALTTYKTSDEMYEDLGI